MSMDNILVGKSTPNSISEKQTRDYRIIGNVCSTSRAHIRTRVDWKLEKLHNFAHTHTHTHNIYACI